MQLVCPESNDPELKLRDHSPARWVARHLKFENGDMLLDCRKQCWPAAAQRHPAQLRKAVLSESLSIEISIPGHEDSSRAQGSHAHDGIRGVVWNVMAQEQDTVSTSSEIPPD